MLTELDLCADPRRGEQAASAGHAEDRPRHIPLLPAGPLSPPNPRYPLQQGATPFRLAG